MPCPRVAKGGRGAVGWLASARVVTSAQESEHRDGVKMLGVFRAAASGGIYTDGTLYM